MKKELKALVRKCEEQGFVVRRSSKGHLLFDKDGRRVAVTGGTPSDRRAWNNLLADLKRAGFRP